MTTVEDRPDDASDEYFEPAAETMPRADIEAYQEERVLELVPFAYERSGLIRKTWEEAGVHPRDIRSLDDYRERAPFISKAHLRDFRDRYGDPFGGIGVDPDNLTFIGSTTGTTGEPAMFPENWTQWNTMSVLLTRDMWMAGARPGRPAMVIGSTRRGPWYEMIQLCGAVPLIATGLRDQVRMLCELSIEHRPTTLFVMHMALMVAFDQVADEVDMKDVFSSYRGVVFAGEPLGQRWRERAREWGMRLHNHTSAGDVGGSTECRERNGCHLWEDKVLIEHVDPVTGEPTPEGEVGELVSTALDFGGSVLLRYRSDDLVRIDRSPCPCGRTHARQWPVGRKGDEVVVDGVSVLPFDIWAALESLPETERALFQLIRPQREMDKLRIRVGYDTSKARDVATLHEEVAAAVQAHTQLVPELELVDENALLSRSNGKVARVVPA
jgi:phenylacetate-CoA ligase